MQTRPYGPQSPARVTVPLVCELGNSDPGVKDMLRLLCKTTPVPATMLPLPATALLFCSTYRPTALGDSGAGEKFLVGQRCVARHQLDGHGPDGATDLGRRAHGIILRPGW